MELIKVIFLDIDGVLNDHYWNDESMCGQIDPDKVQRLNTILRETGAFICLSSAWRYILHRGEANLMGMEWLLRSHGVKAGRLIGVTRPDTKQQKTYEWPERGEQITDFITEFGPFASYIAVDDLDIGITEAGHRLVQTDSTIGLTEADAWKAIRLLNADAGIDAHEKLAATGFPVPALSAWCL